MLGSKRPPPLTVAELQDMARNSTTPTERRLLWEVSRLRKIALQAHELDILLTDEKMLGQNLQLTRVAKALREMLKDEPVIAEDLEKADYRKMRKFGIPTELSAFIPKDGG